MSLKNGVHVLNGVSGISGIPNIWWILTWNKHSVCDACWYVAVVLHTLILLLIKMCFSDNDCCFYGWSTSLLSGPGLLSLDAPILCQSVNLVKVVIACDVKIIEFLTVCCVWIVLLQNSFHTSVLVCFSMPACLWCLICVCVCVCVCVCCPHVCLCVCMHDRLL